MKRKLTSILLTLVLLAGLTAPALAADTASVIRLTKTSGTVSVSKSSGKSLSLMSNMRLYNGYHVNTSSASYAWLNLDDTKVLKEDARSDVAVQQNGKKLEVKVWAGNVFFDVSQKLGDDESLNISTSTMIVGIRGTSGYVQVMDRWTTRLTILEGTVVCSVSDPVTGQVKTEAVRSGETVDCVVYPQEQTGEKCDILRETTTTEDIPGFVLTDLVQDVPLCDEILDASGLDILRDLAAEAGGDPSGRSPDGKTATPEVLGETDKREAGDRSGLQEKLDKLEEERKELEDNVSGDKALPTTPPSGGGSSGGGSSGGGSSGGDPTPATFPVTFDANGGRFEGDVGQTIVQTDENGVIDAGRWPADPTNGNLTFVGWYDAQTGGLPVNESTVFDRAATVYAHWSTGAGVYTIRFEANGATTITGLPHSETGPDGKWTSVPSVGRDPNTDGTAKYRFDGWFDALEGGTQVTGDTVFLEDTTVYAHWTIESGWDWAYDEDAKTLRVFGLGAVTDFSGDSASIPPAPWHEKTDIQTAVFEDGITALGGNLFCNPFWNQSCSDLTTIRIADTVKIIDQKAFYGCTALTSISIPNGVTHINSSAFETCVSLTGITIPGSVTAIGDRAFYGCSSLASVTIPSGVTTIGSSAFDSCIALTDVTIPDTVTSIGEHAFDSCSALAEINIPSGVTSIGGYAFQSCSNLKDIYFNGTRAQWDNVTKGTGAIPSGAAVHCTDDIHAITFDACGGVVDSATTAIYHTGTDGKVASWPTSSRGTNFTLSGWYDADGNKVDKDTVFSKDTTVYARWNGWEFVSGTLTIAGDGPMDDYSLSSLPPWDNYKSSINTVKIENGVTSIGSYAFNGCSSLTSITIPANVTSISGGAFYDCSALADIYFNGTRAQWNSVTKVANAIPSGTTVHCTDGSLGSGWSYDESTKTLTITDDAAMADYTVTYSGDDNRPWASYKAEIETAAIQSGVTKIGKSAFWGCANMKSATVPSGVISIGDYAFRECSGLKSLTIPDSVTSIGAYVFEKCTGLESLTVPDSVTSIGTGAFSTCESLKSVNIPANLTSMSTNMFIGCTALESVTIPDKVTSIGNYALAFCDGLKNVTIPASVTSIGNYAFTECDTLESVTIQAGTTDISIGTYAFLKCAALKSVTIPANVNSIYDAAFESSKALTDIYFGGTWSKWDSLNVTVMNKTIVHCSDKAIAYHWSYDTDAKILTITGDIMFNTWDSYKSALETVDIQPGVTQIESYAFQNCAALTEITIPSSVTAIDADAFKGCSALQHIYFGGTQDAWTALSVSLPKDESGNPVPTVHCSGSGTGWSYDAITRVLDISSMTDYSNLAESPWNAYRDELTTVVIRSGVTAIGTHAFTLCSELTSVTIPASVTAINGAGFMQCDKLTTINYEGTEAQWNSITKNDGANIGLDVTINYNYAG